MKKLSTAILLVFATLMVQAQGIAFEPEGTLLAQAAMKAKRENKLVFVDCYTQWCGPCKKMARDVFTQEKVGEYMNARFVSLKIDMEAPYAEGLGKDWQVAGYPTFIIFNAEGKEVGRFMGGSDADGFIRRVEEKSAAVGDNDMDARWSAGERSDAFLKEYLASLTATYKREQADMVAETLLKGKEETFASDPELASIFMRNINNPFASSFVYTVQHPEALKAAVGEQAVEMKVRNVLGNYTKQLFVKDESGVVALDEGQFAAFQALLRRLKVADADHYRLTTLISDAEKRADYAAYVTYVEEYLATPGLDATDMTLANWAKPFSTPGADDAAKQRMIAVLRARVADIEAGKRQPQTTIGNMKLSRPTDELLRMIIYTMETGKLPG